MQPTPGGDICSSVCVCPLVAMVTIGFEAIIIIIIGCRATKCTGLLGTEID